MGHSRHAPTVLMRTPRIAETEVVALLRGDAFFGGPERTASRDRPRETARRARLVGVGANGSRRVSAAEATSMSKDSAAQRHCGARERVEAFAQQAVERADALPGRKSRSPNGRGDFGLRDP
jgi:hypothetical protein